MKRKKTTHLQAAALALFAFLGLAFLLWSPVPVHAAGNFIIEDYDIDMVIQEDDTYEITETIHVHFTAPSHGIYRSILYRTELDRDGQHSVYFAQLRDFEMLSGQPWKQQRSGSTYKIKIGDPDTYANQDTTYKFRYVFDNRDDHLKNADEVYYNLVGKDWEAKSIDQVNFRVTFPSAIDMNNVGIKTGKHGSKGEQRIDFNVQSDRVLTGSTTVDTLGGLTIRAVLPEGYFTTQAGTSTTPLLIFIAILACITAAGGFFWRKYGKDPDVVVTEEFYPPQGLTSAEVGFLKEGTVSGPHVISTLLTLADKGYLKISERVTPRGKRKPKTDYAISMLKECDEGAIGEKAFMEGLFEGGDRPVVMVSELKNEFYTTVSKIRKAIEEKYKDKLYDSRAARYAAILRGVAACAVVALILISRFTNGTGLLIDGDLMASFFLYLLMILPPVIGFYLISLRIKAGKKNPAWYLLLLAISAVGIVAAGFSETYLGWQAIPFLIGMGLCLLLNIMAGLCDRKTDYYADLLGKILGFERFLKVAEKDRMEMLAEQDPDYFYKNLAFAFALGVTGVYASHFASMATKPPQWYDSPYTGSGGSFDPNGMMHSMNSMMSSANSTMTSSPSSGSGGGSFSGGGGGGGGGGGSW